MVTPISPYLLLKDISQGEEVRASGIILPSVNREQDLTRAEVKAVPVGGIILKDKAGRYLGVRPCIVKVGDVVFYEKFRGLEMDLSGERYILLEERFIVALFEG